ncbi:hypothetical protein BU15DRAFT_64348 [Melanogaster broomeanus]|nr:hypothetical protein BU15DRAFT_64348 [Melanogaster broomeanus]
MDRHEKKRVYVAHVEHTCYFGAFPPESHPQMDAMRGKMRQNTVIREAISNQGGRRGSNLRLGSLSVTPSLSSPKPVDIVWVSDRPQRPTNKAFILGVKYTACPRRDGPEDWGWIAVLLLDEFVWLFNFCGTDIELSPVFLVLAVVEEDSAVLFINEVQVDDAVKTHLGQEVRIKPYEVNKECGVGPRPRSTEPKPVYLSGTTKGKGRERKKKGMILLEVSADDHIAYDLGNAPLAKVPAVAVMSRRESDTSETVELLRQGRLPTVNGARLAPEGLKSTAGCRIKRFEIDVGKQQIWSGVFPRQDAVLLARGYLWLIQHSKVQWKNVTNRLTIRSSARTPSNPDTGERNPPPFVLLEVRTDEGRLFPVKSRYKDDRVKVLSAIPPHLLYFKKMAYHAEAQVRGLGEDLREHTDAIRGRMDLIQGCMDVIGEQIDVIQQQMGPFNPINYGIAICATTDSDEKRAITLPVVLQHIAADSTIFPTGMTACRISQAHVGAYVSSVPAPFWSTGTHQFVEIREHIECYGRAVWVHGTGHGFGHNFLDVHEDEALANTAGTGYDLQVRV